LGVRSTPKPFNPFSFYSNGVGSFRVVSRVPFSSLRNSLARTPACTPLERGHFLGGPPFHDDTPKHENAASVIGDPLIIQRSMKLFHFVIGNNGDDQVA
jgi:hypothetical protein